MMTLEKWWCGLLLAAAVVCAPRVAPAVELAEEGGFSINGFGGAVYGRTDPEENVYVGRSAGATSKGAYQASEVGVTFNVRPADNISAGIQLFGGAEGMGVDWAFVELRVVDPLRIRAGKMKQPFGLWNEVFDLGTARPFLILPTSVYGPGDLLGEAYVGAGITGRIGESWALSYDAYGGSLQLEAFEPMELLEEAPAPGTVFPEVEEEVVNDMLGGRLFVDTPVEGLRFGVSGWWGTKGSELGEEEEAIEHAASAGASIEMARGPFAVRAEGVYHVSTDEVTTAGYAEASMFIGSHFQLAVRAENSDTVLEEEKDLEHPLLEHQELAVGVNYWVTPALVAKVSGHMVDGNRYATPVALGDAVIADDFEEKTTVIFAGVQFSF